MRILNLAEAMQVAEIFNKLDLETQDRPVELLGYLAELSLENISKLLVMFDLVIGYTEPAKIVEMLAQHLLENDIYLMAQSYQKLGF